MEALIFCSQCHLAPSAGEWSYQNIGGVTTPTCNNCREYNKLPFFQQLDVIDELLVEANKDLNNESLNQEAASNQQGDSPESKANK